MDKTQEHKAAMLKALEKNLGIVTESCRVVGISRQTHYNWIKDDKDYKPPASVRAMSGSDVSHRSNRSRGMKRSSGSSDENGPEVKKGGRNRKSKPVKSNVS